MITRRPRFRHASTLIGAVSATGPPPADTVAPVGNVTHFRTTRAKPKVMEFFAGIGLARMGLERAGFQVAWANDHEPDKRDMYLAQFGETPGTLSP